MIHVTINGMETPVFCIDLHHHIYKGHCFQALGPTSEAVTWLLNNYPPSFSLTNDEAAARQAAIWYFSDGFVIASPASVAARTWEIINSVPDPLYLPLNPPKLTITPASVVTFLPDETVAFVVKATQDGKPAEGVAVELSTTFGTLSSDQVTTDANGLAAFTLSSSIAGTAEITAKASFTLPRGTELHYTGTGTSQVLVIGTPVKGYVYAEATATWQSNGSITAHKFADNNMNGVQDSGEPNLSGWKMKLYRSVGESWEFVAEGTTRQETIPSPASARGSTR